MKRFPFWSWLWVILGALYFFIEVTDDQHRNAAASADLIWQDCPQLAFDTANNKGTTYDSTDD